MYDYTSSLLRTVFSWCSNSLYLSICHERGPGRTPGVLRRSPRGASLPASPRGLLPPGRGRHRVRRARSLWAAVQLPAGRSRRDRKSIRYSINFMGDWPELGEQLDLIFLFPKAFLEERAQQSQGKGCRTNGGRSTGAPSSHPLTGWDKPQEPRQVNFLEVNLSFTSLGSLF